MIVSQTISFLVGCVLHFASGEIFEHRVNTLPGYPGPLRTRNWSGYIKVPLDTQPTKGTIAHVHYWFVENESDNPSAAVPTVLWEQGGPGGSSMIALLTENGPYTLSDQSLDYLETTSRGNKAPHVFDNPYSWHLKANMLYVDHPAPTGFSYCTAADGVTDVKCEWNDNTQAELGYRFLVVFFEKFPEFRKNPFHLSGESYAGVYAPTLAMEIIKHKSKQNHHLAPWSLEGMILGNAIPGNRVTSEVNTFINWRFVKVQVDFRYGHGMISEATYRAILKACAGHWGRAGDPQDDKECLKLLEDPNRPVMSETGDTNLMGGGYFLYDNCDPDQILLRVRDGKMVEHEQVRVEALGTTHNFQERRNVVDTNYNIFQYQNSKQKNSEPDWFRNGNTVEPNSGQYSCGQERVSLIWLNLHEVQHALHVRQGQFSFITQLTYEHSVASLVQTYKSLLIPNLRIWQYSGDADPCVPYIGTQRWIESLKLPVSHPWRPWSVNNQVAGYTKTFSMNLKDAVPMYDGAPFKESSNITFVTIKKYPVPKVVNFLALNQL